MSRILGYIEVKTKPDDLNGVIVFHQGDDLVYFPADQIDDLIAALQSLKAGLA